MIQKKIQLIELNPEEFKTEIVQALKTELSNLFKQHKPKQPTTWLNRKEVSEKLGVSLATLHNWNISGKLRAHKIGGSVRYKLSDVKQSLGN